MTPWLEENLGTPVEGGQLLKWSRFDLILGFLHFFLFLGKNLEIFFLEEGKQEAVGFQLLTASDCLEES